MNSDIRLAVGFWQHPKTKKTARRLGLEGVRSLQILWLWAAQNRPDGNLSGMDWEDIELAADWQGVERAFFDLCLGMWLDETDNGVCLHDWADHNPWQAEAEGRSDKSRFSRLATVNRVAFDELKAAGVNAISKEDYDRLTNAKRQIDDRPTTVKRPSDECPTTVKRPSDECQRNAGVSLAPSPSPALKKEEFKGINTLTSFECLSSPGGDDLTELPLLGKIEDESQEAGQEPEHEHEPETELTGKVPPCPYDAIVALYHELLPEHQAVKVLSETRRRTLKARWADVGKRLRVMGQVGSGEERLAWMRKFFGRVGQSPFLTGQVNSRDRPPFMADLDFLISPKGFTGVIEGKYNNREQAA